MSIAELQQTATSIKDDGALWQFSQHQGPYFHTECLKQFSILSD